MNKQQPTCISARAVEGARQVRRRTVGVMEIATLIDAVSNFVAQLDAHPVGAAIFLGIIALAAVGVSKMAVKFSPETRRERQ